MIPYTQFPQLLGLLLRLLNSDLLESARRDVLKVLGIMGALDPHLHKRNQQHLQGPHGEGTRIAGAESGPHHARSLEEVPVEIISTGAFFTTNEDYFPTVYSALFAHVAIQVGALVVKATDSLILSRFVKIKLYADF